MAYLGMLEGFKIENVKRVQQKVMEAVTGEDPSVVANELVLIALAIMCRGGATKEQVLELLPGMVNSFTWERSN